MKATSFLSIKFNLFEQKCFRLFLSCIGFLVIGILVVGDLNLPIWKTTRLVYVLEVLFQSIVLSSLLLSGSVLLVLFRVMNDEDSLLDGIRNEFWDYLWVEILKWSYARYYCPIS